ncbi:MAG TPA: cyclic nucleotide-binding domain-containing protein [Candidatus Wunengus sp. YC60]|uniref:cyclic nucleotide-binding domain-containing protein n=1 Tax=Candidatus Wunengus sp. YC60 TaxID=3367697 RepID=UPI0040250DA3
MEIELVCKKGEIIFKEGDISGNAYIIKTGQVEISKGEGKQKVVLAVLKEGDIFGEMGLIEDKPRSATATALDDVRLKAINHEKFNELFLKDPASLIPFFKAVFERLRTMNEMLHHGNQAVTARTLPQKEQALSEDISEGKSVNRITLSGVSELAKDVLDNKMLTINKFPFKIGRRSYHTSDVLSSNDLYLDDDQPFNVSRNHFSINLVSNNVYVTDRGSTLGTVVNGVRISGDTPPMLLNKQKNEVIVGGMQSPFKFEVDVYR